MNYQTKLDALIEAAPDMPDEYPAFRTESPVESVLEPVTHKQTIETFQDFPQRHKRQGELTNEDWKRSFERCLKIANAGGIVALIGDRGTGKTQMAWQIAQAMTGDDFVTHGKKDGFSTRTTRPAIYRTAMDMFLELRSTYSPKADKTEFQTFKDYEAAALLVIDEITVRTGSEFEDMKITAVMDKRYAATRPTILIGNMTSAEFVDRMGKSVVSRISECGAIVECKWPSFRTSQKP